MRSAKELEAVLHAMHTTFDGKETEQNWKQRDNQLLELSKITEGNASKDFHQTFVSGIRSLLDGIIACVISERTTLSNHACDFVRALAKNIGSSIHPMLDYLLPPLVKLCASTKPISSRAGNEAVKDIVNGARTYNTRLLHHICSAFTSENSAPRIYAPGWLEMLIKLYGPQIDHTGGVKQVEDALKRSLLDANSKARENSRALYWAFAKQWPSRAEPIMATLEPQRQRALQDDPNNPNKPAKPDKFQRPGSSLAEAKAQAKKSMQAKRTASDQEALPFVISLDNDRSVQNAPQPQAEKKKAPLRSRHDTSQQNTIGPPQALQPITNPSTSGSGSGRPDTGHGSIHSKSGSMDSSKSQESSSTQRARPLMAAPVRRAVRVVSNSTPAPPLRPNSREGQATMKEAKHPLRPRSAETPTGRPASRSPILEQPKKLDVLPRVKSQNETKLELHDISVPLQRQPEIVEKTVEQPRRRPGPSKDTPQGQAAAKLHHALKRVRNLDLAPTGFTKLRLLLKSNGDTLFTTKQAFDDVMFTMLFAMENIDKFVSKYLQDQPEDAYASVYPQERNVRQQTAVGEGLARDYRFCIVAIFQSMLSINAAYFASFNAQVMRVVLNSRAYVDDTDHRIKDLEEMAWNIIARGDQLILLNTVFDVIEDNDENQNKSGQTSPQTLVMGLQALTLLFASAHEQNVDVVDLDPLLEKGVNFASHFSHTFNPKIRKASIELCVVLERLMGARNFEDKFRGDLGTMKLLTYYFTRGLGSVGPERTSPRLVGWGERE